FNDAACNALLTLSLHDALPISEKSLYEKLPDLFKDTDIKLIRVQELSFAEQKGADTTSRSGQLSGLSFALESIRLHSLRRDDTTAFWHCDDIKLDSRDLKDASADGMYSCDIANIKSSLKDGFLNITDIKRTPQYPESGFSQKLGTEGGRYHIVVEKIRANKIGFKDLELNEILKLSSLRLENEELRIFNNKMLP